jgi:hypothetical protein
MANVLNEFLHGVSKDSRTPAIRAFSRRRSRSAKDIALSFGLWRKRIEPANDYLPLNAAPLRP